MRASGLLIVAAIPWAVARSLAFRAHNTAWRNIRFAFGGRYREAFLAYLVFPFVGVLTLGLLYPHAIYRQRRFMVDNGAFGTTRFAMASSSHNFFKAFLAILAIPLIALVVMGTLSVGARALADPPSAGLGVLLTLLLGSAAYFLIFALIAATIANLTYQGARFGDHQLTCRLPALPLAWIYFSNAVGILLSLGLLIPWTQIRVARFRLAHMGVLAAGSLEDFVQSQGDDVASLGAEFGEALDLDVGL